MHLYPLLFSLHEVTVHHLFTAMYLISSSWHLQQVVLDLWIWIWYFFPVSQLSGSDDIFAVEWSEECLSLVVRERVDDFPEWAELRLWALWRAERAAVLVACGVTLCWHLRCSTFQWSHKCTGYGWRSRAFTEFLAWSLPGWLSTVRTLVTSSLRSHVINQQLRDSLADPEARTRATEICVITTHHRLSAKW